MLCSHIGKGMGLAVLPGEEANLSDERPLGSRMCLGFRVLGFRVLGCAWRVIPLPHSSGCLVPVPW